MKSLRRTTVKVVYVVLAIAALAMAAGAPGGWPFP